MAIEITDFEVMDISIPEPPIQVECLASDVDVSINDKKYIFSAIKDDDDDDVGILETDSRLNIEFGMYHIKNIPIEHPIGIHTNSDDIGIASEKLIEIKPKGEIVINVSGGVMSAPHYTFKLEDGTDISKKIYDGEYKCMKNKSYVFKNAGVSGVHPFRIGSSRNNDLDWVLGTQLDAQTSRSTN